jgi:hypothetical protein
VGDVIGHLDGRGLFLSVRLEDGGLAVVCRRCGASLRLLQARTPVTAIRHAADCGPGVALAAASAQKPVWLEPRHLTVH